MLGGLKAAAQTADVYINLYSKAPVSTLAPLRKKESSKLRDVYLSAGAMQDVEIPVLRITPSSSAADYIDRQVVLVKPDYSPSNFFVAPHNPSPCNVSYYELGDRIARREEGRLRADAELAHYSVAYQGCKISAKDIASVALYWRYARAQKDLCIFWDYQSCLSAFKIMEDLVKAIQSPEYAKAKTETADKAYVIPLSDVQGGMHQILQFTMTSIANAFKNGVLSQDQARSGMENIVSYIEKNKIPADLASKGASAYIAVWTVR